MTLINKINNAEKEIKLLTKNGHLTEESYEILTKSLLNMNTYYDILSKDYWINSRKDVVKIEYMDNEYIKNVANKLYKMFGSEEVESSLLYEKLSKQLLKNSTK